AIGVCDRLMMLLYSISSVIFFFQADDGIRDFHVTGVQTCALPISGHLERGRARGCAVSLWLPPGRARDQGRAHGGGGGGGVIARSEERRVGKECRSRLSRGRERRNVWRGCRGRRDEEAVRQRVGSR